jgi:gluconate 5-dehydrogenase
MPTLPALAAAFDLSGRAALVTGGGSGLGLGMARCLAAAGAKVVLVGRREAELRAAAADLGPLAYPLSGDITAPDGPARIAAAAEALVGPLSILVNNAGVHLKKAAVETSDAEFAAVLNTHVNAAFALTRAVAPGMLARGDGSILFIASMTTLIGMPRVVAYSAAKAAYGGIVRALASEFGPQGVRVNAIAPGWIESPMLRQALSGDPAREAKILARTPMARFGDPDDIGHAAVYLASPAARFVNGVVLPVDGGASIGF